MDTSLSIAVILDNPGKYAGTYKSEKTTKGGLVKKIKKISKPTLITTKDVTLRNQVLVTENLHQDGILGINWLCHLITENKHTQFKKTADPHKHITESILEPAKSFKDNIPFPRRS
jgi:hypothetical protein